MLQLNAILQEWQQQLQLVFCVCVPLALFLHYASVWDRAELLNWVMRPWFPSMLHISMGITRLMSCILDWRIMANKIQNALSLVGPGRALIPNNAA